MTLSDEELINGFYLGRERFFDELFSRYKGKIFNFALRLLDNRADAEDATADVFLKLYENRWSYEPRAKFSTWLFAVTRNACLSRIRQKKPVLSMWFKKDGEDKSFDVPDEQDGPQDEMIKRDVQRQVQEALAKLPMDQKEVLVLREFQQFSYQDIAQITGLSLNNVKVMIHRARVSMQTLLPSSLKEDFYG